MLLSDATNILRTNCFGAIMVVLTDHERRKLPGGFDLWGLGNRAPSRSGFGTAKRIEIGTTNERNVFQANRSLAGAYPGGSAS
jgi:hypothetical protein